MITVIPTQSRFSALAHGVSEAWHAVAARAVDAWRARRALREARRSAALPNPDLWDSDRTIPVVSPQQRSEDELRAAYRLFAGGDPLGRL